MGQHAKTVEANFTRTRETGQIENTQTADSFMKADSSIYSILEPLRQELLELQSKSTEYTFTVEEEKRLRALEAGLTNVNQLRDTIGKSSAIILNGGVTSRVERGVLNTGGVQRIVDQTELVFPSSTRLETIPRLNTLTSQEVANPRDARPSDRLSDFKIFNRNNIDTTGVEIEDPR